MGVLNVQRCKTFIENYEKKNAILRYIYTEEICMISHEPIKKNEYYYKCSKCNNCINHYELKQWFSVSYKNECPMCKNNMETLPILYKNSKTYFQLIFDICSRKKIISQ